LKSAIYANFRPPRLTALDLGRVIRRSGVDLIPVTITRWPQQVTTVNWSRSQPSVTSQIEITLMIKLCMYTANGNAEQSVSHSWLTIRYH